MMIFHVYAPSLDEHEKKCDPIGIVLGTCCYEYLCILSASGDFKYTQTQAKQKQEEQETDFPHGEPTMIRFHVHAPSLKIPHRLRGKWTRTIKNSFFLKLDTLSAHKRGTTLYRNWCKQ